MPLSEHEQRVLEQIERALYAEDPKFAASVRGIDVGAHYRRRIIRGSIGLLIGLAMLLTGLPVHLPPISIAGFLVMLLSALYAVSSTKRLRDLHGDRRAPAAGAAPTARAPRQPRGKLGLRRRRPRGPKGPRRGMGERLEERWRRRFDEPDI